MFSRQRFFGIYPLRLGIKLEFEVSRVSWCWSCPLQLGSLSSPGANLFSYGPELAARIEGLFCPWLLGSQLTYLWLIELQTWVSFKCSISRSQLIAIQDHCLLGLQPHWPLLWCLLYIFIPRQGSSSRKLTWAPSKKTSTASGPGTENDEVVNLNDKKRSLNR